MSQQTDLHAIALQMVSDGRGILAADESIKTMSSRLEGAGVEPSEDQRRNYRELLLTPPSLADTVSGVIWCDETFRQRLASTGETFPEAAARLGILAGIKVDTGTAPWPTAVTATVTHGLDGLEERLREYALLGAGFAKWRAVIDPADPDGEALDENASGLASYAKACQEAGIVPIVEPEVLCNGSHDIATSAQVTRGTLDRVFAALVEREVDLKGIVLKPNMITPGLDAAPASATEVADATIEALSAAVPSDVPGIAFLSGGHSNAAACSYLAAINLRAAELPWRLTYSFGRALVSDALNTWKGEPANLAAAQEALLANCGRASVATAA